ncbi:MAG TPA: hypothetical protein VMQ46_09020 [Acidimicrobiia bacterium]|nr:hypothetical protein [Acidimicrobiia bacterium]
MLRVLRPLVDLLDGGDHHNHLACDDEHLSIVDDNDHRRVYHDHRRRHDHDL